MPFLLRNSILPCRLQANPKPLPKGWKVAEHEEWNTITYLDFPFKPVLEEDMPQIFSPGIFIFLIIIFVLKFFFPRNFVSRNLLVTNYIQFICLFFCYARPFFYLLLLELIRRSLVTQPAREQVTVGVRLRFRAGSRDRGVTPMQVKIRWPSSCLVSHVTMSLNVKAIPFLGFYHPYFDCIHKRSLYTSIVSVWYTSFRQFSTQWVTFLWFDFQDMMGYQ